MHKFKHAAGAAVILVTALAGQAALAQADAPAPAGEAQCAGDLCPPDAVQDQPAGKKERRKKRQDEAVEVAPEQEAVLEPAEVPEAKPSKEERRKKRKDQAAAENQPQAEPEQPTVAAPEVAPEPPAKRRPAPKDSAQTQPATQEPVVVPAPIPAPVTEAAPEQPVKSNRDERRKQRQAERAAAAAAAASEAKAKANVEEPISPERQKRLDQAEAKAKANAERQARKEQARKDKAAAKEEAPVAAIKPDQDAVKNLQGLLGSGRGEKGGKPARAEAADRKKQPPKAEAVTRDVIDFDNSRNSMQAYEPAPVDLGGGKKSGLSSLEKAGLVALGALTVGAILNQGDGQAAKVLNNTGDRVLVEDPYGSYNVYRNDDALLYQPGVNTQTERFKDGSTRTTVQRPDGTQVITIRDVTGRVLQRVSMDRFGKEHILIDDLAREERGFDYATLPPPRPDRLYMSASNANAAQVWQAGRDEAKMLGRQFSLRQIRENQELRDYAVSLEVDNVHFATGQSYLDAYAVDSLADIGLLMQDMLDENPNHVFLVEGHTDAVGSAGSNLMLSDRRAETTALALSEYYDIPPENMVVQGYGESDLLIPTDQAEVRNRRVMVRLLTPLLR